MSELAKLVSKIEDEYNTKIELLKDQVSRAEETKTQLKLNLLQSEKKVQEHIIMVTTFKTKIKSMEIELEALKKRLRESEPKSFHVYSKDGELLGKGDIQPIENLSLTVGNNDSLVSPNPNLFEAIRDDESEETDSDGHEVNNRKRPHRELSIISKDTPTFLRKKKIKEMEHNLPDTDDDESTTQTEQSIDSKKEILFKHKIQDYEYLFKGKIKRILPDDSVNLVFEYNNVSSTLTVTKNAFVNENEKFIPKFTPGSQLSCHEELIEGSRCWVSFKIDYNLKQDHVLYEGEVISINETKGEVYFEDDESIIEIERSKIFKHPSLVKPTQLLYTYIQKAKCRNETHLESFNTSSHFDQNPSYFPHPLIDAFLLNYLHQEYVMVSYEHITRKEFSDKFKNDMMQKREELRKEMISFSSKYDGKESIKKDNKTVFDFIDNLMKEIEDILLSSRQGGWKKVVALITNIMTKYEHNNKSMKKFVGEKKYCLILRKQNHQN